MTADGDGQLGAVPLGTGLPTKAELQAYYPPRFTWQQLKTFINSGDLGLLKRDKKLQQRYDLWVVEVKRKYGSQVGYLLKFRLQWGAKQDTLSLLSSALDDPSVIKTPLDPLADHVQPRREAALPPLPDNAPAYFKANISSEYLAIMLNDWPYSVPSDVEHTLIWTRVPIYHPDIVAGSITARIEQDGIWGFTGNESPPPSPSTLPQHLPALAEWGMTVDKMIKSPKPTPEEESLLKRAGKEVDEFVKQRWNEDQWETAWFVNPVRLQSVPGLAHIHVFARQKRT